MPAESMCDQSRETCELNGVRNGIRDGQIDLAVFGVRLGVEVVIRCQDLADVVRLASIIKHCRRDYRHER